MPDRCVDCDRRPTLHQLGACYSETFPVRGPDGAMLQLTLRLCLRCGARFSDRAQLRDYLRTRLPSYAVEGALARARG